MEYTATTRMRPGGTWVNEVTYGGEVCGRRVGGRYSAAIVDMHTGRVVRWTNVGGRPGVGQVRVGTVEVDRDGDKVCFHCHGGGWVRVRRTATGRIEQAECQRCGGGGKEPK